MNQAKIDALVEHLQEGGSLDKETLADVLTLSPNSTRSIQGYLDAAVEQDESFSELKVGDENPNKFVEEGSNSSIENEDEEYYEDEQEPEPEPEPEKKNKKTKKKDFRFFFTGKDGQSVELEIDAKNDKVISFVKKEVHDEVKLMIRGKLVLVDIVPLRKLSSNSKNKDFPHLSNDAVLKLALAAK
tara:strand:+ start:7628 stop:8185 length:558 start_codon:yes stop_codon:yes gene_type:complete